MNIKQALLCVLLWSSVCYSMEIRLPGATAIKKKLVAIGMQNFIEHTNIVSQLADQEVMPWSVVIEIQKALYDYFEYLDSTNLPLAYLQKALRSRKTMLNALLQDHPGALAQLEKDGLITQKE